jgi:cytochrome c peroxidase
LLTNHGYTNIGLPVNPLLADNPIDLGLGGFLKIEAQNGKFKIPTLRNVALTAPYGHNGYFATLKDIIRFKNTRDLDRLGCLNPYEAQNRFLQYHLFKKSIPCYGISPCFCFEKEAHRKK